MIVLDDLNDYIGALEGHPQALTPNIDKLASEGVLFTNAHTNAPLCSPSRAEVVCSIEDVGNCAISDLSLVKMSKVGIA